MPRHNHVPNVGQKLEQASGDLSVRLHERGRNHSTRSILNFGCRAGCISQIERALVTGDSLNHIRQLYAHLISEVNHNSSHLMCSSSPKVCYCQLRDEKTRVMVLGQKR